MTKLAESIPAHDPPAWFDEFASAQLYAQHIVLSGNTRDVFPTWDSQERTFVGLAGVITGLLARRGVEAILHYDQVTGLVAHGKLPPDLSDALRKAQIAFGTPGLSLPELARLHGLVSGTVQGQVALIIDYAAHLHGQSPQDVDDFLVEIDSHTRNSVAASNAPSGNLTVWLADGAGRLPNWFVVGNDFLREIHVELPNLEDRYLFAGHLADTYAIAPDQPDEGHRLLQQFALECDGETLVAMASIAKVAQAEGIRLNRITDAIRVYRTGMRRNPWNSNVLTDRVHAARELLERRIKGQQGAIDKTVDILARSIIGLSGSQSGARHHKPRGILFLAGPTGVGKTELAKAVTALLFGDEAACHRFDMSEFMEESSIGRLVGAPPGHPGHERGGELVNAAHRRPFSVFLFDEVEKAHPRILDVFLQILDEGRLTDSRGSTAHFSEALIIFTSNIGTMKSTRASNMGMNVLPSDSHDELARKITHSIEDHFRVALQRPELLNRIGQNIIIFDFLSGEAAHEIFDAIVERVLETVTVERGIRIELHEPALSELRSICTENYFEGGRGIGNRIESHFINPLAREVFDKGIDRDMAVVGVRRSGDKTYLELVPLDPRVRRTAATP